MTSDALRCADAAEARAEPLYGTASFVRSWLLLEQPGSWGRDALDGTRFPSRVAGELRARARRAGVRIVLIRRGVRRTSDGRHAYFARTDERAPYLSHVALDRLEDVLDVDLAPLGAGRSIDGSVALHEPLFLVCTHGRHDVCCSIRGNEVSRVACAVPGADVWESSHIGGDRFAANVVCFPHGVYYGRVAADEVAGLMERYARGALSLSHYRGRSCYPFTVQAAEYFARRAADDVSVDGVTLVRASRRDEHLTAAFGLRDGRRADVELRVRWSDDEHRLTCRATRAHRIPRYELVSCMLGGRPHGEERA